MVRVYFQRIDSKNKNKISQLTVDLFKKFINEEKIELERELPIKIHVGEPGNTSYLKSDIYDNLINYLISLKIKPYFIETTTVSGFRKTKIGHEKVARDHNFTQIPFVIADGERGESHQEVEVKNGKHFQKAKIAQDLADKKQVLVISHFKGHCHTGFGGAIKNLGIGFASRIGKIEQHSRIFNQQQKDIDWGDNNNLFIGELLEERIAEYALAASFKKNHLYINFAINLVSDCDCDGRAMKPLFSDLGIFVSHDPVAIDKACLDLLDQREGKITYEGKEIFDYGERIELGKKNYRIIE